MCHCGVGVCLFNKVAEPGGVFASWFSSSADVSVSDRLQRFFFFFAELPFGLFAMEGQLLYPLNILA